MSENENQMQDIVIKEKDAYFVSQLLSKLLGYIKIMIIIVS